MKREDIIQRGLAAKNLLENKDFILIMDTVRLDAFKGWAATKPEQSQEREHNYFLMKALDRIYENINALISGAQYEERVNSNN